jgi:hypothetical protein
MRSNACLLAAICAVLAASTAWAAENATSRHHHHGRHVTHTAVGRKNLSCSSSINVV